MAAIRTNNNKDMLVWARNEVGYTIEQAAEAIGISADNLKAAESGERPLTLNQLQKAAEKYDCPFGYFYLSKPPHNKSYKPVPDFRIEPGLTGTDHYRLNLEIKKVRDRRLVFIDLIDMLGLEIKPFHMLDNYRDSNVGSNVRARLGVKDSEVDRLTFDQTYNYWKSKIEQDGVLVYESQHIPEESKVIGAAIYYGTCPIILIKRGPNENERKLFTLLHEYAHLLKGKSAINDAKAQTVDLKTSDIKTLESDCNHLAAEILVPSAKIQTADYRGMNTVEMMKHLAHVFKVTYTTAAVCLRRHNLVNQSQLSHLLKLRSEANEREKSKATGEIKIPREILMRLDMGHPMFDVVLRAYSSGVLNIFDASEILNLRVKKIDKLVSGTS